MKERNRILHNGPCRKVVNDDRRFLMRPSFSQKINVKFLEHLNTDSSAASFQPAALGESEHYGSLATSLRVVGVDKDICIHKDLSGHALRRVSGVCHRPWGIRCASERGPDVIWGR